MLDPKEEQRYKQLRKLGQKLHIPIPEAFLTLEVFDRNGKLIQRHRQRSHSWVRNAYNQLLTQLAGVNADDATFGAGYINAKRTDGAVAHAARVIIITQQGYDPETSPDGFVAGAGIDTFGILVGSGTNTENFEDYVLQTPIAEGTGAGQLSHIATDPPSKSYAGLVYTAEWVRYFNNNSGGSIDVNEVCIVASMYFDNPHIKIMTSRDKLASTVAVPDTGQLKVTYTFQLTYPA